jgi:predicted ATPase
MEDAALQAALEKLADADIVLVQGLPPDADYRFKHALIQDAAYENLLKSRRQVLHRRVAETLRDRFGSTAAAEPEALAYHFTQAGMTDAAIEWWGKAGDQALRRSAFQEAISHLGKAIEMADKAGEGAARAAAISASPRQRLKLQTSYSQAMMLSRGFGAEETRAAFTRAQELAQGVDNAAERFDTYYGLWVSSILRGELGLARDTAETFLRDAKSAGRTTEVGVASRNLGMTCLFQGDLTDARAHLEEALRIYDPERDREAKFRFGTDPGAARGFLAHANWALGEVARARELIDEAVARAIESDHAPTLAYVYFMKAMFEILRGDAEAVLGSSQALVQLSREHQMGLYLGWGLQCLGWAGARLGDREAGMTELRQALAAYLAQGNKLFAPFFQGALAELEAEAQDAAGAEARVDAALALAGETGDHWTDAFLHRIRGEILLRRDPANAAPAEEAFLTAIAIAQQQKARSFELRAALSLAKLYQSTARAADAHAVLAPALEGFSPTPEFPEIEETQTLLAALAETGEVKSAAAQRQRRLQLQVSLANALLQSRGQHAADTKAAFSKARELASGIDDPLQRFSTYYGLWVGGYVRGEKATMVEAAAALLKESDARPDSAEAGVAHRVYGVTCWMARGDLMAARKHLEQAAAFYRPDRDRELAHRFAQDVGVAAKAYLSLVQWALGECDRARTVMAQAMALAVETKHAPTLVYAHYHAAFLETIRLDPVHAKPHMETCLALAREHGVELWTLLAPPIVAWAKASSGRTQADWEEMRRSLADCRDRDVWLADGTGRPLLAAGQAEAGQVEAALATVDQAIAETQELGLCFFEAEAHHIRGEILLKRDPANTGPAEEAFLTAIAIAQQQKARSFELRATLSLAKLYQSSGRPADARAVLAPALKDFSPTPEFPEIEEAQTLLAALAS